MENIDFYKQHLRLLEERSVGKLVELDYHDDAVMLILTGDEPKYVNGKKNIAELFEGYLQYVYRGFISTEKLAITDDCVFLEATIDTKNGPLKVYDAMYMKDGKIFRHFTGIK
jgi:hypothetical protein